MGVCAPGMTEENHQFMYSAMKGHLTESTSEKIDVNVRGLIQGVSLSSFLQMAEMEGSTCTLAVKAGNRTGTLHLLNGNLIDAEAGSLEHRDAAYAILSWENAEIYIQKPSGRKNNEINLPLMHILIDALKKKDKIEYEQDAFASKLDVQIKHPSDDSGGAEPGTPVETAPAEALEDDEKGAAGHGDADSAPGKDASGKKDSGRRQQEPDGKKKRTYLIALGVVVILLAGGAVYWILQAAKGGHAAEEYAALMAKLETLTDEAAKEKLLNAFIDTHTDDPVYTDKAMQALFNVLSQMEASDYKKARQAVYDLPLDRQYFQKAKDIFDDFLKRYPESRFRSDISKKLAEISELADDNHFGELGDVDQRDYLGKLAAYGAYLNAHPDGRHREEVQELARETLRASYREFSINIEKCKKRKKWDDCMAFCRQYRETFQRYMDMAAVDKIEAQVRELQALDVLKAETEGADAETVRKRYLAFLKSYPNSSERRSLEKRVAEIEKQQAAGDEWLRAKAAGQDTTKTLSHRIALLRRYVDQNPRGPYLIEAENLLWKLEQQAKNGATAGNNVQNATGSTKTAPQPTADKGKTVPAGQDHAARLENLQKKVINDLAKTKGRYVVTPDGTVRDNVSGLVWTMLDSFHVLGRCVDYRQAETYVNRLTDGGHIDWRIPTSAELAGIYQNSPYFPAGEAEWYWSSEVYEKGYQTIAKIVNAKPEAVYRKRTANVRKCGAVHAVRP